MSTIAYLSFPPRKETYAFLREHHSRDVTPYQSKQISNLFATIGHCRIQNAFQDIKDTLVRNGFAQTATFEKMERLAQSLWSFSIGFKPSHITRHPLLDNPKLRKYKSLLDRRLIDSIDVTFPSVGEVRRHLNTYHSCDLTRSQRQLIANTLGGMATTETNVRAVIARVRSDMNDDLDSFVSSIRGDQLTASVMSIGKQIVRDEKWYAATLNEAIACEDVLVAQAKEESDDEFWYGNDSEASLSEVELEGSEKSSVSSDDEPMLMPEKPVYRKCFKNAFGRKNARTHFRVDVRRYAEW